jgi:hypothetical protein
MMLIHIYWLIIIILLFFVLLLLLISIAKLFELLIYKNMYKTSNV